MITGKVKIKITGWQTLGEESDTTVLEAEGICIRAEDGYKIQYIEKPAEDMEVENIILFSPERAVIVKKGMIESEMVFIPRESKETVYKTPFGVIDMLVRCESVCVLEEADVNRITITYSLYSGEQLVSNCKTLIEIRMAE